MGGPLERPSGSTAASGTSPVDTGGPLLAVAATVAGIQDKDRAAGLRLLALLLLLQYYLEFPYPAPPPYPPRGQS